MATWWWTSASEKFANDSQIYMRRVVSGLRSVWLGYLIAVGVRLEEADFDFFLVDLLAQQEHLIVACTRA